MSKSRSMSVRLSPDLNKHVADIARALDRPHSWVIEQAIKDFVAVQVANHPVGGDASSAPWA
jgi:predicted transcriptional regulator